MSDITEALLRASLPPRDRRLVRGGVRRPLSPHAQAVHPTRSVGRFRPGLGAYFDTDSRPLHSSFEYRRRRRSAGSGVSPRLLPAIQGSANPRRRSHLTPSAFVAPYLRSELSVAPNPSSGLSQHETLCRLAQIEGALVYYACPLLFDVDKIYEYPDLQALQIVDVVTAPPDMTNNGRHFLAFQSLTNLTPCWCSEPRPAESRACSDWIREST
jgi:hypothetical protein